MDWNAYKEEQIQKIKSSRMLSYSRLVKDKYHDKPGVYDTFLHLLYEYTKGRIDPADMHRRISKLFSAHPELIEGFCNYLPQEMFIKNVNVHERREFLMPAKKAKIEDDSTTAVTEFGPTSNASTSHASNPSPSSSGCYLLKRKAVASGSSSSQSWPGNALEAYKAQKRETAQWRDRTLYVTERKTKLIDGTSAYEHLEALVNEIRANRIDIYNIMERASVFFQGYPELIESFNGFLSEGFRIVVLSDDHEMNTY